MYSLKCTLIIHYIVIGKTIRSKETSNTLKNFSCCPLVGIAYI